MSCASASKLCNVTVCSWNMSFVSVLAPISLAAFSRPEYKTRLYACEMVDSLQACRTELQRDACTAWPLQMPALPPWSANGRCLPHPSDCHQEHEISLSRSPGSRFSAFCLRSLRQSHAHRPPGRLLAFQVTRWHQVPEQFMRERMTGLEVVADSARLWAATLPAHRV